MCLLCRINPADKKNSHVIPKFITRGLFRGAEPRHAIEFNDGGNSRIIQDTEKLDYILCSSCERRIGVAESHCSQIQKYDEIRYKGDFTRPSNVEYEYIESKKIDIKIFNLFIYSIVWRASICDTKFYEKFKLRGSDEEKLRAFLDEYLDFTIQSIKERMMELDELPHYSHIIFRPEHLLTPPQAPHALSSISKRAHKLNLVDYLIWFVNSEPSFSYLKELSNNRVNGKVRLLLADESAWIRVNQKIMKDFFNK